MSLMSPDGVSLPERKSIDPLALVRALPHVFVIELEPESQRLRYRLAGEEVNGRYERSILGRYLDEITPAASVERVDAYFRACATRPAIVLLSGILFAERPEPGFGERLLLPVQDTANGRRGLFGITYQRQLFPDVETARKQSNRRLHIYPLDGSPVEIMDDVGI